MKKFIFRIFLFLLPFFVFSIVLEYFLRSIPNDYSYKKNFLDKYTDYIEILFLGSSHTYYGINPYFIEGFAFNASHVSQTIDLDYKIISFYSNRFNNLSFIVLSVDYFTLFSRIADDIESWRVKNYNIYYSFNLSKNIKYNYEMLSFDLKTNLNRITSYYLNGKDNLTCSKLGYGNIEKTKFDLITTGKTAADRHTKINKEYFNESVNIIDNIIKYAKSEKIVVILYSSPAFFTYVENLEKEQLLLTINTLKAISENNANCYYFNFLQDNSFTEIDFRDADHLNKLGAIKFSKMFNSKILEIKNEINIKF